MGWESGHGSPESSGSDSVTIRVPSGGGLVLRFHLKAQPAGGDLSKFTHVDVGRIQLLMYCWTGGFSPSLAAGQRLPSAPSAQHGSWLSAEQESKKG